MKKIFLITTTRADYGIMSRLIEKMYNDDAIDFHLIATGMHLSEKFGNTIEEINLPISYTVDIEIEKTAAHVLSLTITKFTDLFSKEKPDLVVVLGDRFETLGVATASMLTNTPIAHIHGGETTEGAIDEAIRHSITKMSHLHFTSCEAYRERVIQLGENPSRVYNVGALGVENIKKVILLPKDELEKSLDFNFSNKKNFLITFHPVTLEVGGVAGQIKALCDALSEIKDTGFIFTMPNADEGNEVIFETVNDFIEKNTNAKAYKSLGMVRYLSTLQYIDAVIGNSSSGILEAPSFKIPTINIGNRQKGRIQADSIINCEPTKVGILEAINNMDLFAFKEKLLHTKNPYEKENTADNILEIIKKTDFKNIVNKSFYNIYDSNKKCG